MKVAMIVGSASPPGRLASAVETMASFVEEILDVATAEIINLAITKVDLCDGRPLEAYSDETRRTVGAIVEASTVLIAAPVYKASLPGVLKNLLDLLPVDALQGKPVGIISMGGSPYHYLAVDSHLRQILAWFGALATPTSIYLTGKDFSEGRLTGEARIAEIRMLADTLLRLVRSVDRRHLGPPPLAAKFT